MKDIQQKQWVKKPQAEYLHQILGDLLAISLFYSEDLVFY